MNIRLSDLSSEELAELSWAYQHLEHPSLAARLSSVIGVPMEQALHLLPQSWHRSIEQTAERSIKLMLDLTIDKMNQMDIGHANDHLHRMLVFGTGAVGGFFGPLMLLAELPLTTALMLRSIADIARSQGEDLSSEEAKLACMQVFALGGRTKEDSAADTGYYGLRLTLSLHFSHRLLQFRGVPNAPIPAGINLLRGIASRFGVVISDKVAAQMVPVVGAVSGAMLNLVFMHHFQDIARGHFIVRRLERSHGQDMICQIYQQIQQQELENVRSFSPLEGW